MNNEFRLKGKKNDDNSVSLTLRIADFYGKLSVWFFLFLFFGGGGGGAGVWGVVIIEHILRLLTL